MRGIRNLLSWVLALFLAALLAYLADAKLFADPNEPNVIFATIAEKSGIALAEPTGRYVTGIIEAFAALMLILPVTRRFGALLALAVSAGAVGVHLSPYLGQEVPVALGASETDGGQLFYLALALLAASGLLSFVHPRGRKRR